jgi:hypothetical protein
MVVEAAAVAVDAVRKMAANTCLNMILYCSETVTVEQEVILFGLAVFGRMRFKFLILRAILDRHPKILEFLPRSLATRMA